MALFGRLKLAVGVGLSVLSMLALTRDASAQLSADPYKPYNAQYEQYIYPSYPTEGGVAPNQSLLEGGGGGAHAYQRFMEEEDEMDRAASNSSVSPGRRGVGVPYYRAYRDYDKAYSRVYTPNKKADEAYLASRQTRDDLYSQYLKETDPKKKASLLKEYQEYNQRAMRELNETRTPSSRRSTARADATATPRPPIPGTERSRNSRDAATSRERSRSSARPSNAEILRRSEALDQPLRSRPAPPAVPARRPALDDAP
ncbi:MAG: hypothetical protein P4L84_36785 [Isosphaeraceae bacterium]|nr:hypothetical protein [Isosphaeraceae bacterium]